jgi:D-alanine-D-alanine ligase
MRQLRVLMLVHFDCVPPEAATVKQADWAHWKTEFYVKKALLDLGHELHIFAVTDELMDLQTIIEDFKPHIVFNLLEEFQGEPGLEGHVNSYLELMGVPYTGCNPQGLALGRDKALSKKILDYQGLPTPGFFTVEKGRKAVKPDELCFPLMVKSLNEEASLGISQKSVVYDEKSLRERVRFVHESIGTTALVEEYIEGRELYVGVIGNQRLTVLEPWELHFGDLKQGGHGIASRSVKFSKEYCEKYKIHRGPAQNLSPFVRKMIENYSRDIFKALKMSGYVRLDFRLTSEQELYFLEANPNAELADQEDLANAARHTGIPYNELIAKILRLGLNYQPAA